MQYEKFLNGIKDEDYYSGDIFWVCDVRQSEEYSWNLERKLKPTEVVFLLDDKGNPYFVKTKKDKKPSKTKISIYGTTNLFLAKPFEIFETEPECKKEYSKKMKRVFMDVNHTFDSVKESCKETMNIILADLIELEAR